MRASAVDHAGVRFDVCGFGVNLMMSTLGFVGAGDATCILVPSQTPP
jgi:hypothetical protein